MEQNWKVLMVGHNNVLNQLVAMAIREELRLAFRAAVWVTRNMGKRPPGVNPNGLVAAAGQ